MNVSAYKVISVHISLNYNARCTVPAYKMKFPNHCGLNVVVLPYLVYIE